MSEAAPDVTKLMQGDLVITLSPGKLDTSFVASEEICHRVYSEQEMKDMIGFMAPSCTALLAVRNHGHIGSGDVSSS